jgi:hypothetical protein
VGVEKPTRIWSESEASLSRVRLLLLRPLRERVYARRTQDVIKGVSVGATPVANGRGEKKHAAVTVKPEINDDLLSGMTNSDGCCYGERVVQVSTHVLTH